MMQVESQIVALVAAELPCFSQHLRDWVDQHLIIPRQESFSQNENGTGEITLWLITDNIGKNDSSYRIVFDEFKGRFGLVVKLQNEVEWLMGFYGGFAETVEAM